MPAPLLHVDSGTPMGANLIADGATFRVWAPNARAVYVVGDFNDRRRDDESLLQRDQAGHWHEVFNGNVYENWVNPHASGNGGAIDADPQPMHAFSHSAALLLPANSVLVFAR